MTTWAISIQVPPEEQEQALLASVQPLLESLQLRPFTRAGNVLAFDLLSSEGIRQADSYLLLLTVDDPSDRTLQRLVGELGAVLPTGSAVSALGEFASVARSSQSTVLAW